MCLLMPVQIYYQEKQLEYKNQTSNFEANSSLFTIFSNATEHLVIFKF